MKVSITHGSDSPQLAAFYKNAERSEVQANTPQLAAGKFIVQKKHGYGLEHLYSKNYQAVKNHYYLIQIGHMIGQFMEAWEGIWKKVKQSLEQKHKRLLESMKETSLKEYKEELGRKIQIRFIKK